MEQQRTNLQTAYNQALGQRTPDWAIQISNAMPSIAEIIAAGTTKGAFNQGKIADSLERQKDRQIAYNQWLKENEDKMANDYVQIAKEQLGMDIAEDDKKWNRGWAEKNFDYKANQDVLDRAYRDKIFEFDKDKFDKTFGLDVDRFNWDKDKFDKNYGLDKRKVELLEKQALAEAEKTANSAGIDTTKFDDRQKALLTLLDMDLKKGNISSEDYIANVNSLATTGQLLEKKTKKSPLTALTDFSTQVTNAIKPNKTTYKNNNKVTITEVK